MIDAPCFHQRILPVLLQRVVECLRHVDHDLLEGIAFEREFVVVQQKGQRLVPDLAREQTLHFVFGGAEHLVAGVVLSEQLEGHPAVHAVEHAVLAAVVVLGLSHEGIGGLVVSCQETLIELEVVTGAEGAGGGQQAQDRGHEAAQQAVETGRRVHPD